MTADFSARIKALRLEKRLRQNQLAALLGVEKSTVSMYETDMRRPTFETLVLMADIFGVSTDYLLGRKKSRTLDLAGLTDEQAAIISALVCQMVKANQKMEELRQ